MASSTFELFVMESTNIERALLETPLLEHGPYNSRHPRHPREVIQKELKKLLPIATQPALLPIAEVVKKDVQRAIQTEIPVIVASPKESTVACAAVDQRSPLFASQYQAPIQ